MSQINVGYQNNSPQAIDLSYGAISSGVTVPYGSVAAANAAVPLAFRHRGKTVIIDLGSGANEYWWRVSTADASLVPKLSGNTPIDFVIGDGGSTTPANNTTVYTNPAIINCRIQGLYMEGGKIPLFLRTGTTYAIYDPVGGTITLTNGLFTTGTWWSINLTQL